MSVFMVERSLAGITMEDLGAAQKAAIERAQSMSAAGTSVRYIRSTFAPHEGRCMCLFEAESDSVVQRLNEDAGLPFVRIIQALDLTAPPEPTVTGEMKEDQPQDAAAPIRHFDSFGMNPRTLRFFLLEKDIDLPRQEVDILSAENRGADYLELNPAGQTPALELADGTIVAETPAICEYLEELNPEPPLIGRTAEERAVTRMWWRRVELNICQPMVQGFYYAEGLDLFRERIRCLPEAAEGLKERARDGMRWLDGLLTGDWIAGDRFTVADICLYCYIDQLSDAGQPIPGECARLKAWFDRVHARPAAEASIWKERPMGMRG